MKLTVIYWKELSIITHSGNQHCIAETVEPVLFFYAFVIALI